MNPLSLTQVPMTVAVGIASIVIAIPHAPLQAQENSRIITPPPPSALPTVPTGSINQDTAPSVAPSPQQTTVACVGQQTVISRAQKSAILISWQTNEFGAQYTPERRCQIVSQKLQAAVDTAGGKLSKLHLTNGPVNNRQVICVVAPGTFSCNSTNMLFTLKRENERKAASIIRNMTNFKTGSAAIVEDSGEQAFVNLGDWADGKMGETTETEAVPSTVPENDAAATSSTTEDETF